MQFNSTSTADGTPFLSADGGARFNLSPSFAVKGLFSMMNATPLFPSGRGERPWGFPADAQRTKGQASPWPGRSRPGQVGGPAPLAARTAAAFGRRSFAPSAEVGACLHQFPEMVRLIVHVRIALFCSFADRLISRRARAAAGSMPRISRASRWALAVSMSSGTFCPLVR